MHMEVCVCVCVCVCVYLSLSFSLSLPLCSSIPTGPYCYDFEKIILPPLLQHA